MAPRSAPHRLSWEQLEAFPPSRVTIDLTVHLDGPSNEVQIGWRLRDTTTDATMAMGALRPTPLGTASEAMRDAGAWLLEMAHDHLGPF